MCVLDDSLRIVKQALKRTVDIFTRRGQSHTALISVEELDAKALFELLNLDRQRRLRNVQVVRGACEVAGL